MGKNVFLFDVSQDDKQEEGKIYTSHKFGLSTIDGEYIKELDFYVKEYISGIRIGVPETMRPLTLGKNITTFYKKLYILSRNGKDIFIYNQNGDLLRIIRFNILGKKIKKGEKDKRFRTDVSSEFAKLRQKVGTPERRPLIYDIVIDDTERLWLKQGDTFGLSSSDITQYEYIILNNQGNLIATQKLPIDLKVVKNNFAYGFVTDENDLRIFKKYRLYKN